jgi:hypothetical protein
LNPAEPTFRPGVDRLLSDDCCFQAVGLAKSRIVPVSLIWMVGAFRARERRVVAVGGRLSERRDFGFLTVFFVSR